MSGGEASGTVPGNLWGEIMRALRRSLFSAVVVAVALVSTGCYYLQANDAANTGAPVPWFCNPVAPNSVTGPGMGSVDWYVSIPRASLDYETCKANAKQFDAAKAYAKQFPTLGDALGSGFRTTFSYIPGMGTHTGLGTVSPELLVDPSFNPLDPIIPNSIIDDVFDPAQPEFLQYGGNTSNSKLVGLSYYVRTNTGLPPAGFAGTNDRWHHHPALCLNKTQALAIGINGSDSACTNAGGVNVHLQNYYMLHLWVVDDLEYRGDIHGPVHPCIQSTPIFDMNNSCHQAGLTGTVSGASAAAKLHESMDLSQCPLGTLKLPEQ